MLLPLLAGSAVMATVALGERAGAAPFAGLTPRNSAEAAGMGAAAEVLRFLAHEDPRAVQPVRPEVISSSVLRATTLEAAVWSRQLELIQLLERAHPWASAGERQAIACLASDLDVEDVAEYLAPGGTSSCAKGEALDRVLARTRQLAGR
jgi:hypothetical protein